MQPIHSSTTYNQTITAHKLKLAQSTIAWTDHVIEKFFDSLIQGNFLEPATQILILYCHDSVDNSGMNLSLRLKDRGYAVVLLDVMVEIDDLSKITTPDIILDLVEFTKVQVIDISLSTLNLIQSFHVPIFSLDLPYGLDRQSGLSSHSFKSSRTFVLHHFCYGHLLNDGLDVCGAFEMIPLDVSEAYVNQDVQLILKKDMHYSTLSRKHNRHKYNYGHLLVIGGSPSMMGSVALTSLAAFRCGVGLVNLATHASSLEYTRQLPYELMTPSYQDEKSFQKLFIKKSAIVFGMGLSKEILPDYMISTLLNSNIPMVIDADGLYHIKEALLTQASLNTKVLTPHLMEFSRLVDQPIETIQKDLVFWVRWLAKKTQAIIVLKGPITLVGCNDQMILLEAGNPGLATAGTGDVLAGMIGAHLALMPSPLDAVVGAITAFSICADQVALSSSHASIMASDIINQLKYL